MARRGRGRQGSGAGVARRPHAAVARARPGRGRRGSSIGGTANAEAGQQYNPEIRGLRQQAKGSRVRERDLGSWYRQLAADYKGAQDSGTAALQSLEDTTSKQLADANASSSADQARLAAQDESFAKLVGGPRDTAGLAKIAQAGAAAARSRVALTQPAEAEQANLIARLGSDQAAARLQGVESTKEERGRRGKILSDLAGVRKEKGLARVTAKTKLSEAARDAALERSKLSLASREAGTDERKAAAEAALARLKASQETRQDAIGNRQAQERIGISRKNAKTTARSQRATARHYRKENKGGLSTGEKRARGEHAHDAMSAAKALLGIKVPKNSKEWSTFEAALIEKLGASYSAEATRAVATLRKQQASQRRRGYERRSRGPAGAPH